MNKNKKSKAEATTVCTGEKATFSKWFIDAKTMSNRRMLDAYKSVNTKLIHSAETYLKFKAIFKMLEAIKKLVNKGKSRMTTWP